MYTRPSPVSSKPATPMGPSLSSRPTAFARTGTMATGTTLSSSYARPVVASGTVKAIPSRSSLFCCLSSTTESRTPTPPAQSASRYAHPFALPCTRTAVPPPAVPVAAAKASAAAAVGASSKVASDPGLCCDKCNGKHETDACPIYKKPRENHPDAQKNFYKSFGNSTTLPGAHLGSANVVRQPVR
jgi:hypothetical protein